MANSRIINTTIFATYFYSFLLLLLCSALTSCDTFAKNEHIRFEHLQVEDGLPSSTIYDAIQDSKGFIWFATETGVSKYDGYQFINYTMKDGLPNNGILRLVEDSSGRIWMLSMGALAYYQNEQIVALDTLPQIAKQRIYSLLEDANENIWFTTKSNIYFIDKNNTLHKFDDAHLKTHPDQRALHCHLKFIDEQGDIWAYLQGTKCLVRLKDKSQPACPLSIQYPVGQSDFRTLANEGNFFYVSKKGIVQMDVEGNQKLLFTGQDNFLPSDIYGIVRDRNQHVWLSSISNGVLFFPKGDYTQPNHFLQNVRISTILEDDEGNLWFPTLGSGVYFMTSAAHLARNFTSKQGLSDDNIHSIYVQQQGNKKDIWVGGTDGVVNKLNRTCKTIITHDIKQKTQSYCRILGMQAIHDSLLLFITDVGIAAYYNDQFIHHPQRLTCKSAYVDKQQNVWISTASNTIKISTSDLIQAFKHKTSLSDFSLATGRVYTIAVDKTQTAWLGKNTGLYQWKNDTMIYWGAKHPTLSLSTTSLKVDQKNQLWVTTHGGGVVVIKDSLIQSIEVADGLSSNICKHIFIDKQDHVWISGNKGISKINSHTILDQNLVIDNYDINDGLISNEVNKVFVLDQQIYIGTTKGLSICNESAMKGSMPTKLPRTYITNVHFGGEHFRSQPHYDLHYPNHSLQIDFAGICYHKKNKLKYVYQLDGLDKTTQTISNRRVHYSSLPAGCYTFKVNTVLPNGPVRNTKGVADSQASFNITVHPPFWNSQWFLGLVALVALGILGFIYRMIVVEGQRKQLKILVNKKTAALQQNILELERSNEQLKEFAYIASHDLKEPLRTIASYVQLLQFRYGKHLDETANEFIAFAVGGVKRLQSLIDGLLLYSRLQNREAPFEWIDMNIVVKDVQQDLNQYLTERQATIEVDHLPIIYADAYQMRQLMQNLIHNGIKFNTKPNPKVFISSQYIKEGWQFTVRDNGIGINPDFTHKIFMIFKRLHTQDRFSGTGLGLAICKRIIERHEGDIYVQSTEGEGATFYFSIQTPTPPNELDIKNIKKNKASAKKMVASL